MLKGAKPQVHVHAALHDAEQRLVGARMGLVAALGPHAGELDGAGDVALLSGVARALVKLHADVAAELLGDRHVVLGRPEHMATVVIGGDEAHALIGELDRIGMGEDLEAARVREDGTVPVHEVVQAAELGHRIGARAHGQVIGIGEHDLGAQVLHGLGGECP